MQRAAGWCKAAERAPEYHLLSFPPKRPPVGVSENGLPAVIRDRIRQPLLGMGLPDALSGPVLGKKSGTAEKDFRTINPFAS